VLIAAVGGQVEDAAGAKLKLEFDEVRVFDIIKKRRKAGV
jgi:hypothetical protein